MSKHSPINVTAERTIAATPEALYDIVTDLDRIGELSPECTSAEWLGNASGPAVGAKFKGTNQLGDANWSTKPKVTAATRGQIFEFKVPMGFGPTWRYEFEAVEGGTRVVETVSQGKPSPWFIRRSQVKNGVTDRAASLTDNLNQTLANLETIAA